MSISISGNGSFTGATADYSFDQSVGIAGTLTYEDVTSIDSVGVITARSGINVGPTSGIGITLNASGSATFAGDVQVGGNPHTETGVSLRTIGLVKAARTGASDSLWAGYTTGNSSATSEIYAGGSASFAGVVQGKGLGPAYAFEVTDGTTNMGGLYRDSSGANLYLKNSAGDDPAVVQLKADGSATFAGGVQSGNDYTAGDGVNIFAGGSIYIRQDGATGGVLRIRNGSDYKIELKGNGDATFLGTLSAQTIRTNSSGGQITADYNFVTENTASSLGLFIGCSDSGNATTSNSNGGITGDGALFKTSGTFKINHPLPAKRDTHHLVHSFIEGPQADNIYSGMVTLVAGRAEINLDTATRMTEGTFLLLNTNLRRFVSNEGGWTAVKSTITGNILTVEAQDNTCTDEVFWTVIGERHDQNMIDAAWTDENGRCITEPLKS